MQKRGQASPDDGDALALTFAQAVAAAEVEERDEDEEIFGGYLYRSRAGRPQSIYAAWDGELWIVVSLSASGSPSNT